MRAISRNGFTVKERDLLKEFEDEPSVARFMEIVVRDLKTHGHSLEKTRIYEHNLYWPRYIITNSANMIPVALQNLLVNSGTAGRHFIAGARVTDQTDGFGNKILHVTTFTDFPSKKRRRGEY